MDLMAGSLPAGLGDARPGLKAGRHAARQRRVLDLPRPAGSHPPWDL